MFPQDRNMHGKIFGGYVMRKAFELAWVSAPVNIGSVSEFTATVVYSRDEHLVVQVLAYSVDPQNGVKTKTNIMRYVFESAAHVQAHKTLPQ
eukprot:gene29331-36364_t